VYLSDRRDQEWLQDKASVIAHGIRALASLPLQSDNRLLGVAYADTDDEAKIFSELDADLLEAFAERASATLAAVEIDAKLARMESVFALGARAPIARWSGDAPVWDETLLRDRAPSTESSR
jgi:GAF domain-containing protein